MSAPGMLKAAIYARKSTEQEDRQILSLEAQQTELVALAQQRAGAMVVETIIESASAKRPNTRPAYRRLLQLVERGVANAIIVWHTDRLARNAVDAGYVVDLLDRGKLEAVITPTHTFRNTPFDKFFLGMQCGQAKLENDNKSVAVKRGLRMKAERGWYPTFAPLGYLNTPELRQGTREVKLDPERAPIVRRLFEAVLAHVSPPRAMQLANEAWGLRTKYGNPLTQASLYRVLGDRFYYGVFEYPRGSGVIHAGSHPPIITEGRVHSNSGHSGSRL